jgi:glyoxylase-like metal-dependent hydrolase (beta-lactamase superfamily II)
MATLAGTLAVGCWGPPAVAVESCSPGDIDLDGFVGITDMLTMLGQWGVCVDPESCPSDLDGDGMVGIEDFLDLLASWGPSELLGGAFPAAWISGGPDCGSESDIQKHFYNSDTYILRQSLCTNFEAPFIYLLFGQDKVLMQDTGTVGGVQIGSVVYGLIDNWLEANGRESIELVVSHSHAHGDHTGGDGQFVGQPDTTVIGLSWPAVANFFGITDWPTQIVEYDLGGRTIDVIPIPGHQTAHIALYDRQTGLMFTGDTLYAGRLYISDFPTYLASIQRLVDFTADKPACHVLGTHIEMSNTPGVDFPLGSTHHPDEHPLQLDRSHLLELLDGLIGMQADPHIEVHDEFIIWPF